MHEVLTLKFVPKYFVSFGKNIYCTLGTNYFSPRKQCLQLEMERCKKSDFIFNPSKRILEQNDQVGAGSCQERGNQTAVHLQFVSNALLLKFKCP